MPQHKSAAKRVKTSAKATARNRAVKSRVRGAIKVFEASAEGEDREQALRAVVSELDRAAKKGVIPKQRVHRKKARLSRRGNQAAAQS